MLVSNLTERKRIHYLKIELIGTRSNRQGLGATVKLHAGDRTWTQHQDGKSGHLAQSAMPLYFGLGDTETIDFVEVLWPSGVKQSVKSPSIDRTLKITQSEARGRP